MDYNGCQTPNWKIQNETNWEKENLSPILQYNFIEGNSEINYIGKIENFEEDYEKYNISIKYII